MKKRKLNLELFLHKSRMKISASSYFQHWDEEDQTIPLCRVVLELGLSRCANKKPSSMPMENSVELVMVRVTRDQEGDAVYMVTSSDSPEEMLFIESTCMKEEKVQFLRLLGIAVVPVPWMNDEIYDGFTELLEGPFAPSCTMSSWTDDDIDTACSWKDLSIFSGIDEDPTDKCSRLSQPNEQSWFLMDLERNIMVAGIAPVVFTFTVSVIPRCSIFLLGCSHGFFLN